MGIVVVVDANVILSALLGGKPSNILFDGRFTFVTARFTLGEVEKYFPRLAKKLGVVERDLENLLTKLPLEVCEKEFYKND